MKRLLSTKYSPAVFNLSIFLLRVAVGFLMCLNHGIPKIVHFDEWQHNFFNLFHLGHKLSLMMSIFAEVFASLFLILGLFTRFAALLIVIDMFVAIFLYQFGRPLVNYENAILFFAGALCILLVGPGRLSVDGMTGK